MRRRVTILQEYIPAYRVPLFEQMRDLGLANEMDIRVAAGEPHGFMSARADAVQAAADVRITQRELAVFGRRVVLRKVKAIYAESDLVVVEQARRNADVYAALVRHPGKVAMWGHGRDFTHNPGPISTALQRAITNRADWFFGYTPESVASVVEGGFRAARTTVLWNTTDTVALRRDLDEVSAEDIANFRSGSRHVALFVGGLDQSKRLDLLIEACDIVAARLPGFALVVGGAGDKSGEMVEAAASRPWLRVVGPLAGKRLATALRSADVMAMPGRVGLVAVDALVASLPVVTTTWPHHGPERSYLSESNSVTVDEDAAGLGAELVALLENRSRLARLAEGCARAAAPLSIEAMAARFVDGIQKSLDQKRIGRQS